MSRIHKIVVIGMALMPLAQLNAGAGEKGKVSWVSKTKELVTQMVKDRRIQASLGVGAVVGTFLLYNFLHTKSLYKQLRDTIQNDLKEIKSCLDDGDIVMHKKSDSGIVYDGIAYDGKYEQVVGAMNEIFQEENRGIIALRLKLLRLFNILDDQGLEKLEDSGLIVRILDAYLSWREVSLLEGVLGRSLPTEKDYKDSWNDFS